MRSGVNVLAGRLLTEYAGWIRYQPSIPPYHAIYAIYGIHIFHIYIYAYIQYIFHKVCHMDQIGGFPRYHSIFTNNQRRCSNPTNHLEVMLCILVIGQYAVTFAIASPSNPLARSALEIIGAYLHTLQLGATT